MEGAMIGASLLGGALQSNAARKAGETQAAAGREAAAAQLQAGREANQLQWQMYQQNLANQTPYLTGGQSAYAALLGGMGLASPRASGNMPAPAATTPGQMTTMPVGGGRMTTQESPATRGELMYTQQMPTAVTGETFARADGTIVDAAGNPVPVRSDMGVQNYGATQAELDAAGGQFAGQFAQKFSPQNFEQDPSYQFRLNEGLKALQASGAARGTLLSGQGLKDITNYAQGAASQEYQSAFDRYRTQQSDIYSRLSGLAGVGQTATGAISQAGQNAATQMGSNLIGAQQGASNYLTGAAASQAAGQVGSANAWAGGIGGAMNNAIGWQFLQGQKPGGSTWSGPSPTPPPANYGFGSVRLGGG